MGLLEVLLAIVVVGVIVWLLLMIPMPEPFPTIVKVVAAIFLILWILRGTGLLAHANIHV
jgi:hypothetical protein